MSAAKNSLSSHKIEMLFYVCVVVIDPAHHTIPQTISIQAPHPNMPTHIATLRKIVKLFKSITPKDQKDLLAGVGVVQYTLTLRRTSQCLPGDQQSSATTAHSCVCELIGVQSQRGGTRLPHQITTAVRGLRRGLSGERRAQAFFRALLQLKGVRIVELPPLAAPSVLPPAPTPVAVQQDEPEPDPAPALAKPSDEDVPDSWDSDSDSEE